MTFPDVVEVELDAEELGEPIRVGQLRRGDHGAPIGFEYAAIWLDEARAFPLDPSHGLWPGQQFPPAGMSDIAGIFADIKPDRWGERLLDRSERHRARVDGRAVRTLGTWNYLLGVSDHSRMGALRLIGPTGDRLADTRPDVPPLSRLRELEAAAWILEQPSRGERDEVAEQLALLLAPGSSLGGARPKAGFVTEDGELWMAKFPSRSDKYDVAACESALNRLAGATGISVPESRLLDLGTGEWRTFAARRFDRARSSRRLYASAMTLTGKRDGQDASYVDLAFAIADHGAAGTIDDDLAQLYRRVIFNVLVANRDDHLRNHGFLRTITGWRLAPAFDLNPSPTRPGHALSINGDDDRASVEDVLATADFYHLSQSKARAIVDEVRDVLAGWCDLVADVRLDGDATQVMEAAIDR